jgi:hypothetical protein
MPLHLILPKGTENGAGRLSGYYAESSWKLFVVVMNYKVAGKRDNFRVVSLAVACCDSNVLTPDNLC